MTKFISRFGRFLAITLSLAAAVWLIALTPIIDVLFCIFLAADVIALIFFVTHDPTYESMLGFMAALGFVLGWYFTAGAIVTGGFCLLAFIFKKLFEFVGEVFNGCLDSFGKRSDNSCATS